MEMKERAHRWEVERERRNVGGYERGARLGVGAGSAIAALAATNPVGQAALGVVGLLGLATGITGYCPMSRKLGRDTYHHRTH